MSDDPDETHWQDGGQRSVMATLTEREDGSWDVMLTVNGVHWSRLRDLPLAGAWSEAINVSNDALRQLGGARHIP